MVIANRGEIALRIIRAAHEMGIKTVMVYSKADQDSLPVRLADESYCIGLEKSSESYMRYQNILTVALSSKADAIHPGYGFLSENPDFAELCKAVGLIFIGPSPESITLMGDKAKARETMIKAGVPISPGSDGNLGGVEQAVELSRKIGFPLIIKASAGGGGKGMRIARSEVELINNIQIAQTEAKSAFGDASIYVERYIENPNHIEVQILGDQQGHVVHLGERDCSVQRRYQKLIEETPSPKITPEIREKLGASAIKAAQACGYYSTGTVEFLVDQNREIYFIEMNTRIQVEHPITESITGLDLIKEQIRVAEGNPLSFTQSQIQFRGHSMECRINAEDPEKNFRPCPGLIEQIIFPGGPGVRIDSAVYPGYVIPPYYDSMIAKVIVHTPSRQESIVKMKRALREFVLEGVKSTIPFLLQILENQDFTRGTYSTHLIEKML